MYSNVFISVILCIVVQYMTIDGIVAHDNSDIIFQSMELSPIDNSQPSQMEVPNYTVERRPISELLLRFGNKYVCPDGGSCPGYQSCCLLINGRYGCCPFPLGVCCPDRKSCCRQGYRCIPGGCSS